MDLLRELVRYANNRVVILPGALPVCDPCDYCVYAYAVSGGGLTERNVRKVLDGCRAQEFHISARCAADSKMQYRNTRVFMGGALRPPEFSVSTVDCGRVSRFLELARTDTP